MSGTGRIADQDLHKIIQIETRKVVKGLRENRQTRNSETWKDRVKLGSKEKGKREEKSELES